jgi:hypothetical protein
MRDNNDEFTFRAPNDTVTHLMVDYSKSWKGIEEAREMDPYMQHRRSWGLVIDFGISFIPTSMPLPSSLATKRKYARCNILTLMSYKTRKSLSSTLPSGSMIDLSYLISCLLGMI